LMIAVLRHVADVCATSKPNGRGPHLRCWSPLRPRRYWVLNGRATEGRDPERRWWGWDVFCSLSFLGTAASLDLAQGCIEDSHPLLHRRHNQQVCASPTTPTESKHNQLKRSNLKHKCLFILVLQGNIFTFWHTYYVFRREEYATEVCYVVHPCFGFKRCWSLAAYSVMCRFRKLWRSSKFCGF
jgi:hypothetical protein